jgi:PhnB protein
MAVDTVPDGLPTIPILATTHGNQLYAFLERAFEAKLLDRHDLPSGEPASMAVRIGDSVISVMRPLDEGQPTRSAFYVYVPDVDLVHRRAVAAGARSIQEPTVVVHGDRMGTVIDPFGNQWTVASRIEQISVEELHRRLAESQRSAKH